MLIPVLAIAAVAVGTCLAFTIVPIPQHLREDFVIPGVLGECQTSSPIHPPKDGNLMFSWTTNNSKPATLNLLAAPDGPGEALQLYSNYSTGGSADWVTWSDYYYNFEFCGDENQSAIVTGTLNWNAPLF